MQLSAKSSVNQLWLKPDLCFCICCMLCKWPTLRAFLPVCQHVYSGLQLSLNTTVYLNNGKCSWVDSVGVGADKHEIWDTFTSGIATHTGGKEVIGDGLYDHGTTRGWGRVNCGNVNLPSWSVTAVAVCIAAMLGRCTSSCGIGYSIGHTPTQSLPWYNSDAFKRL